MTEKAPTCETCRFWDTSTSLDSNDDASPCRRRSPRFNKWTGLGIWPFTEADDWCGEHQPQESEDG